MKYLVRVGDKTFNIDLSKYPFETPRRLAINTWQFIYKNQIYLITTDIKKDQVTFWLDGEKITAQVQEGGAGLKLAPALELKGPFAVKSAMPGLVKKIKARAGQRVEKGQGLLVLEAMKMENEIVAPAGGVVQSISVKENQSIETNAPLLTILSNK